MTLHLYTNAPIEFAPDTKPRTINCYSNEEDAAKFGSKHPDWAMFKFTGIGKVIPDNNSITSTFDGEVFSCKKIGR